MRLRMLHVDLSVFGDQTDGLIDEMFLLLVVHGRSHGFRSAHFSRWQASNAVLQYRRGRVQGTVECLSTRVLLVGSKLFL